MSPFYVTSFEMLLGDNKNRMFSQNIHHGLRTFQFNSAIDFILWNLIYLIFNSINAQLYSRNCDIHARKKNQFSDDIEKALLCGYVNERNSFHLLYVGHIL